jgi:hypothetical protein
MTDTINTETEVNAFDTPLDEIKVVAEANDYVTPYQCATIVNEWLKVHNILDPSTESGFKETPPQMYYNYTKKGYITVTEIEGKRYVNIDDLRKWYVGYVTKTRAPKITKSYAAPELV